MLRTVIFCLIIASLLSGLFASRAEAAVKKTSRRLDGAVVASRQSNLWPVAVMIDNLVPARPQAGLDKAAVVYEALAEGGIPRFMAVYAQYDMPLVGPVRSARPYFVRYAAEYRAGYAHAGGSPDALKLLRSLRMPNMEGVKGRTAKYFFRRGGSGVHTLFTTGPRLKQALRGAKYDKFKPTYRQWKFKSDAAKDKRPDGRDGVTVDLGAGRAYAVKYTYHRGQNAYLRFTGGIAHRDKLTKKQLAAKNVVLLHVPKARVLDAKGRIELKTIGKGKATLHQDGKSRTVRWRKDSTYDRTIFTESDGREVEFTRGSIWITVVPAGRPYRAF